MKAEDAAPQGYVLQTVEYWKHLRICGTCGHWRLLGGTGGRRSCTAGGILEQTGIHDPCHLHPPQFIEYWLLDDLHLKDRQW